MFHLDYLSCFLTVLATILLARKSWIGLLIATVNSLIVVLKQSAGDELLLAVRKVHQGASYLSPLVAQETVNYLLNQGARFSEEKQITKRQSEILQLLLEGMSMKEVAHVIDVRPGTVAFHKYRMMETLNVKTNAELLEYAIKRRVTSA
jgi:DNA-binding NarL/FixJ family response regulator